MTQRLLFAVIFVTHVVAVVLAPNLAVKLNASDSAILGNPVQTTTSITQYGITWGFLEPVKYGRFVTGDYYIIAPDQGVTVTSVSPSWNGSLHGSMLNPLPKGGQAFTTKGYGYDASLQVTFPVKVFPGDALLSSVSETTTVNTWNGGRAGSNDFLETVTILTVLSSAPPEGTFRPCPSDRSQTLHHTSEINTSLLPRKSTRGIVLPSHPRFETVEYFERGLARPWILFGKDWQARTIHPKQQMFNYHQQIGEFLSEASILLMTDLPNLTRVLNGFIQVGIDYYHTGVSDSATWAMPLVITGILLDDASMYNFWINNPAIRTGRGHEKLYYIGDRQEKSSSLIVPKGQTWVEWKNPEGKYVAFSKQAGDEYEHLHPSEWTCYKPHCKSEVYRSQHDVHPMVGMVLSTVLLDRMTNLDVNAMLAHDPIRDYIDRWMTNIWKTTEYDTTGRTYQEEMWHYRDFTVYSYKQGTSGSPFIDAMWERYRVE